MPPTTNTLEATHGHLNRQKPRNKASFSSFVNSCTNSFWRTAFLSCRYIPVTLAAVSQLGVIHTSFHESTIQLMVHSRIANAKDVYLFKFKLLN